MKVSFVFVLAAVVAVKQTHFTKANNQSHRSLSDIMYGESNSFSSQPNIARWRTLNMRVLQDGLMYVQRMSCTMNLNWNWAVNLSRAKAFVGQTEYDSLSWKKSSISVYFHPCFCTKWDGILSKITLYIDFVLSLTKSQMVDVTDKKLTSTADVFCSCGSSKNVESCLWLVQHR